MARRKAKVRAVMGIMERSKRQQYTRSFLDTTSAWRNAVKWSPEPSEHDEHKLMKAHICMWLTNHGIEYYTEASFKNGYGRADIVVTDWQLVIEVLYSETMEQFKSKLYPLTMIPVHALSDKEAITAMLSDLENVKGEPGTSYHAVHSFPREIL